MLDFHGIIFAYRTTPALGELVSKRTAASLPFCGRYRLIDFALSSMANAGIRDVGVIMQRDYQSLLDHIGSGKAWDMSRKSGGLRILPPFGLPEYHTGNYTGTMEALNAVSEYIRGIPQEHIVLMLGDLAANIDLTPILQQHLHMGLPITAICGDHTPDGPHHRYVVDELGIVKKALFFREGDCEGLPALEGYVIEKQTLLDMMDDCFAENLYRFHRDAIGRYLAEGGLMGTYVHRGYAQVVRTVDAYYKVNRDMLCADNRRTLFPVDRPVRTRAQEGVSTYYGVSAHSRRSLVADNCIIEGELDGCVVFSGVRVGEGAKLENCIVMRGSVIEPGARLSNVIVDKDCRISEGTMLIGSERLPTVVPKGTEI